MLLKTVLTGRVEGDILYSTIKQMFNCNTDEETPGDEEDI